jgi:hypothetical protein
VPWLVFGVSFALLASLSAAVPMAASAAPATLKGRVVGSALPDSGEGAATVRAVNVAKGVVGGADFTGGQRDRWKLRLPPGPYALGAAAAPFAGGKVVDRLVAFARARSGKTETLKLRLKRKRKGGHRRASGHGGRALERVPEGFGDVDVDYPAIWVKEWDVQSQDPDLGVLRKGLADMLITDLIGGLKCKAVIVERARIDDVLNEQRLQRLPGFDPDTRVPQGRLIRDNASVSSTLTESGGQLTMSATYVDRRTGRSATVSVQGSGESLFELEQQLAAKLAAVICQDKINHIAGTYSGTFTIGTTLGPSVMSYQGNVAFDRSGPNVFGGADGFYILKSGGFTLVASGIDGTGATGCRQTGTKNFTIPSGQVSGSMQVDGTPPDFDAPYDYSFYILPPFETMTVTRINCPSGASDWEGTTFQWGLFDSISTREPHTSDDGITYQSSEEQTIGGSGSALSWSLVGSE